MLDIQGVIPAILTPFTERGEIDETALRREIRYMLDDAGVHGITVTGTTGEGYALSAEEVRRVTEVSLDEIAGKAPLVAGIIVDSTAAALRYVEALQGLAVDALQVTPVHYLFDPGPEGHIAYFRTIGEAARKPIIIYNVVPWTNLSVPVVNRLVNEVEWVQGIKQSNKDIHKVADLLLSIGDKARVYTAVDDHLYASFALGAHGTISALPTILPKQCVGLWNAVQAGDHTTALALHKQMLPVWRSVEAPDMPVRIKTAVNLQGRSGGFARSPFQPPAPELVNMIRSTLVQSGII